ncbi:MAG: hypothetical protein ACI9V1_001487 [Spirosomataceae bacterium]|jgi:hypothetical protein
MNTSLPTFYDRYIKLCNDVPLATAFEKYDLSVVIELSKLEELGDTIYAEDKWNVKQILQHCIDTERIMSYRALRFARNDKAELPGFDQDLYVAEATVSERTVKDLIEEYNFVRKSTELFFKRLSTESLQKKGIGSKIEISVEHLGYMILGHLVHHQNILIERYYPLIDS